MDVATQTRTNDVIKTNAIYKSNGHDVKLLNIKGSTASPARQTKHITSCPATTVGTLDACENSDKPL